MRIFTTLLLLIATICGFAQGTTKNFPDKIQSSKTTSHTRIKGTKIYISLPAGYNYIPGLARYQKRQDLYFQVNETEGQNFETAKSSFTKQAIEAKGVKVDEVKNIHVNRFDGVYADGPSVVAGQRKTSLIFGDENFLVMIVGVYDDGDNVAKKELWSVFKSVYYDKAFTPDPLEFANFTFDKSITNFKYAATSTNMLTFAENGREDAQNNTANAFTIVMLPEMTEQKAAGFATDMFRRYTIKGIELYNKTITNTRAGNYRALITSSKILLDGNSGILYQAILLGPNSSILFMGNAYTNTGSYLEKFKKTVATIRLK